MISSIGSYYNYYTGKTAASQTTAASTDSESTLSAYSSNTDTLEISDEAKMAMHKAPPPPPQAASAQNEDDDTETDLSALSLDELLAQLEQGTITADQAKTALLSQAENSEDSSESNEMSVQGPPPPPPPPASSEDDETSTDLSTLSEQELQELVLDGTITSQQMKAELESREESDDSSESDAVASMQGMPPPPPPPASSDDDDETDTELSALSLDELLAQLEEGTITADQAKAELISRVESSESDEMSVQAPPPPPAKEDDEESSSDLSSLSQDELLKLVQDGTITAKQMIEELDSREAESDTAYNDLTDTQKINIAAYSRQANVYNFLQNIDE